MDFRFWDDHELNAIDQLPMAPLESGDNSSSRSLQDFFQTRARAAERSVVVFVGVKRDAIDVAPVFDGDAGDEFAGLQRKRVAANIVVFARATDFRQNTVLRFQQYAVHILSMPNRDASDALRVVSKYAIRNTARTAAFLSKFFRGG